MSYKGDTDQGNKESGEPGTNGSTETFLSLIISNITDRAQRAGLSVSPDICSCIYASEDIERYLMETSAQKHSPVPGLITQLTNTLEHSQPSLPRSEGKMLMS